MEIKRNIQAWGNSSMVIVLPPDLVKYLELQVGDPITIKDDIGKHGKFIAVWKDE